MSIIFFQENMQNSLTLNTFFNLKNFLLHLSPFVVHIFLVPKTLLCKRHRVFEKLTVRMLS